jgi:7 transmembrane receptor (rhodopsin family)
VPNSTGPCHNAQPTETTVLLTQIIATVLFSIVYFLGLAGNATLIVTILANQWMRTKSNVFVVSLAIGDFLLILVTVPMAAQYYVMKTWIFGEVLCKVGGYNTLMLTCLVKLEISLVLS